MFKFRKRTRTIKQRDKKSGKYLTDTDGNIITKKASAPLLVLIEGGQENRNKFLTTPTGRIVLAATEEAIENDRTLEDFADNLRTQIAASGTGGTANDDIEAEDWD